MNDDMITIHGFVATDVNLFTSVKGVAMASFRMATTARRWDKQAQKTVDAETNWYNIRAYRYLAQNAGSSIHKGDPVVVFGKLKLRKWITEDGRSGTSPDIEAEAIGHDLSWGTAHFSRPGQRRGMTDGESPEAEREAMAEADGQDGQGSADGQESATGQDAEDAIDLDDELGRVNVETGEVMEAEEVPY
jgi:single-strand DNA-binding protein